MNVADAASTAPSAADDVAGQGRPVRLFVLIVAVWLVAVLAGRLLLAGGLGWIVFALGLPVLLLGVSFVLGFLRASMLVLLFALVTLGLRALLSTPRIGWGLFVLVPVLALSALVAVRVLRAMRAPKLA